MRNGIVWTPPQDECLVPMQSQRPRLFSRSALSKLTVISSGSAVHTSVNQIGMWELGGQATAAARRLTREVLTTVQSL